MIWFEEELQSQGQPDYLVLTLFGFYNQPGNIIPIIVVQITVTTTTENMPHAHNKPGDVILMKELFSKNPSALRHEEPAAEDVLAKYQHKIMKFKEKIQNTTYTAILQW